MCNALNSHPHRYISCAAHIILPLWNIKIFYFSDVLLSMHYILPMHRRTVRSAVTFGNQQSRNGHRIVNPGNLFGWPCTDAYCTQTNACSTNKCAHCIQMAITHPVPLAMSYVNTCQPTDQSRHHTS